MNNLIPMATPTALRAVLEVTKSHDVTTDRADILQNANTLVVRLSATLVARVVQDKEGPRTGTEWFERENALAEHLTRRSAPVIPLHPDLPSGPHVHSGFPMNFWKFVTRIGSEADPTSLGTTLMHCHKALIDFPCTLPRLAILKETQRLLSILQSRQLFGKEDLELLESRLQTSVHLLSQMPASPLHGDAHPGNFLNTTEGLLLTDWEDAFLGPIEWDLSSVIWNARFLEDDRCFVDRVLSGYAAAGGTWNAAFLEECHVARAAVMNAWYPILYPNPSSERREKLARRMAWLRSA